MDYYKILKLTKEPFSNSPDPSFFYQSRQHLACLQKLELALRLRRGLNVIIGDVGTGKTTLCRQLIRKFGESDEIETHLILDPYFNTTTEFLTTVAKIFTGTKPPSGTNDWQLKEIIKQYLFKQGVDRQKTVILIIDEGQKIPIFCLEVLREFLNYETNEYKLLQIVIFAQKEFEKTIGRYANLSDRINLYHYLKPLNFGDTRQMIRYRLEKSSDRYKTYTFFSFPALVAIFSDHRWVPAQNHQPVSPLYFDHDSAKQIHGRFVVGAIVYSESFSEPYKWVEKSINCRGIFILGRGGCDLDRCQRFPEPALLFSTKKINLINL